MLTNSQRMFIALTEYDRKQAGKPGYNRYAIGHYAKGLLNVQKHVYNGHGLRDAILWEFCGKVADKLLKAVKLPKMTAAEIKFGNQKQRPDLEDDYDG